MSEDLQEYSMIEIEVDTGSRGGKDLIGKKHAPVYVLLDLINAEYNEKVDFKNQLYSNYSYADHGQWFYDNDPYVDPTLEALDTAKGIIARALSYGMVTTELSYGYLKSTIMFPYGEYDWRMEEALGYVITNMEAAGYSRYLHFYVKVTEGPLSWDGTPL